MRKHDSYKVGIYCRLSRDDNNGSTESMSISNQRDLLMSYVNERGWEITEIYIDDGYSGTTFNRPDFERMIKDIELGKINLVITKDLSRLGRNYVMTGQYTDFFFPQNGVRFIAINDNVDTMTDDNDIAPFKNILNEMYAKDISKKIKSARAVSAKQGKFMGSKPPYGYVKSPADKHLLIIDDATALTVKRIFSLFANGEPARSIAEALNRDGLLAPRAYHYQQLGKINPLTSEQSNWGAATIVQMLQNQVYNGHMIQGKRRVVSFKTKQREVTPKEEWIVIKNTHEPIIDNDTWELVQKRFNTKKRIRLNSMSEVSLFSGIVRCADCGGALAYNVKQHAHSSYNTYRCGTYANKGSITCSIHSISAELLEDLVYCEFKAFACLAQEQEESLVERLVKMIDGTAKKEISSDKTKLREYQNRMKTINQNIKILFEEKCSDSIPQELFTQLMGEYSEERKTIEIEINSLESALDSYCEKRDDTQKWVKLVKQHLDMKELTRIAVEELIDHIDVSERKKVKGRWEQEIRISYRFIGYLDNVQAVHEISA